MSATLKSQIPGGAILSQRIDKDIDDFITGRTVTERVVISVVRCSTVTLDTQQKGRVNTAKYETVHMAEVRDPHEASEYRHRITQLKRDAGLEQSQPTLFALNDREQCEALISQIRDWGSERDMGIEALDKRWHEILGGGGMTEGLAESFISCRSPQQLKDFAYELGVISDSPVIEDETPEPESDEEEEAEDKNPDEDQAGVEREPLPEQETSSEPQLAASGVGGVPFREITE